MLRPTATGTDVQGKAQLTAELLERHGELVGQRQLARLLGYPSAGAVQKASERGRLPVRTFRVPGRRGKFAFTRDLAAWLHDMQTKAAGSAEVTEHLPREAAM